MQKPERYFKVYFDEGENGNMKYCVEEKNIDSEWEFIPLLVQGYVRCLGCLKKWWFGHDKEASEFLLGIVSKILLLFFENIDLILNQLKTDANFNVLNFLIDKDTGNQGEDAFLGKIFHSFSETKNRNEIFANVHSKYEIKISPHGPVVMYNVFLMNSFIQVQSFVAMLSHLLPRLNKAKSFIFFLCYMVETNKNMLMWIIK